MLQRPSAFKRFRIKVYFLHDLLLVKPISNVSANLLQATIVITYLGYVLRHVSEINLCIIWTNTSYLYWLPIL